MISNLQPSSRKAPSLRMQRQSLSLLSQRIMKPMQKTASLEVYAKNKKHSIKFSVLKFMTVFIQILNNMCSKAEMVYLYERFVLHRSIFLSTYWRVACAIDNDKKEIDGTWKDWAFDSIVKEYKNWVLSSIHSIANRVFCTYPCRRGWKSRQYDPEGSQSLLQSPLQVVWRPQGWLWISNWGKGENLPFLSIVSCLSSIKTVPQDDNVWTCAFFQIFHPKDKTIHKQWRPKAAWK